MPKLTPPQQKQLAEGIFYFRIYEVGSAEHGKIAAIVYSEGPTGPETWDLVASVGSGGDPNYIEWDETHLGDAGSEGLVLQPERAGAWSGGEVPSPSPQPATGTTFERHVATSSIVE